MHIFPEIKLHILAGSVGLLLGLIPMLTRKGSSPHRRSGRLFAYCASLVMISAVLTIALRDKPSFLSLSRITLTSSYLLWGGMRALRIQSSGPTIIDRLGAGVAVGLSIPLFLQTVPHSSVPVALANFTLYWLWTVIAYDLSRHYWSQQWQQHFAATDHGIKMIAVFFAMLSAGAGNFLPQYRPWSILLPNLAGMLIMTGIGISHFYRYRKSRQV